MMREQRPETRRGFGARALLPAVLVPIVLAACGGPPAGKVTVQSAGFALAEVNQRVRYSATGAASFVWSLVPAGAQYGTLDQSGLYVAPAAVPSPAEVTIRACNAANTNDCGEAKLTVVPLGSAPGIQGTVSVPLGLLNVPAGIAPQSFVVEEGPAKPFEPDWSLPHAPGQVLIVGSNPNRVSGAGARVLSASPDVVSVQVPGGQTAEGFADRLEAQGFVTQPNYLYRVLDAPSPNDPLYGTRQFHLTQIDAAGAWNVRTDAARVAVLDTGADFNHPDLQGRLVKGKDFCAEFDTSAQVCTKTDDDPGETSSNLGQGNSGHGTHTTGIIAAATNNGVGVAGVTWGGQVLVVKVFATGGEFTDSKTLGDAIRYAADPAQGAAKVINLSLGIPNPDISKNPDKYIADAVGFADSQNVVVVAAAGNYQPSTADASKKVYYPASDSRVVPVGAVTPDNTISTISARGDDRLIMAPGQGSSFTPLGEAGIWSTKAGGGYEARYGTSESTPQVAAVAGLIRGLNPNLTALEVKGILQSTAKDLGASGRDTTYGFGLLQAGAALRKANPGSPVPPKTTVYVYADRFVNGAYDGNDPKTGRTEVLLEGVSGNVNYKITLTRDGSALPAGTYRVVACVNKNSNGIACDAGDLVGIQENVQYAGAGTIGANVTLRQN